MPVQKQDRDSQWNLDMNDSKYVLAKQATITVNAGYGIYEASLNNQIVVKGDIVAEAGALGGIRFMSSTSELEIGEKSRIDVDGTLDGIFAEGAGQRILNHGTINGGNQGIYGEIWGRLENHGEINGITAVRYLGSGSQIVNHGEISGFAGIAAGGDGTSIRNEKGGLISGSEVAVSLSNGGSAEIVNKGTIRSDVWAIYTEVESVELINRGKIVGDVRLSAGADFVDLRGGDIRGVIDGREGGDTYFVSDSGVQIEDSGTSVFDTVFSSANYTLSAGLEYIQLIGNRDVRASGNAAQNIVVGNKGDNRLFGEAGDDFLQGHGGSDSLVGGAGADVFIIEQRDKVVTVEDYEDGIDELNSDSVKSQADFDGLRIRMSGDDTRVDFGGGTRLILVDIDMNQLSYDDFS